MREGPEITGGDLEALSNSYCDDYGRLLRAVPPTRRLTWPPTRAPVTRRCRS